MCESNVAAPIVAEDFPGDWLGEEDRESVRRRHAESVERWLDQASFANELFKLHAKYGIEQGDKGYKAYRLYLQRQYEKKLLTRGPMVDPLGEGCDCLFCRFDHDEISFRPAKTVAAGEAVSPEAVTPATSVAKPPADQSAVRTRPAAEPKVRPLERRETIAVAQKKRSQRRQTSVADRDGWNATMMTMVEWKSRSPKRRKKSPHDSSAALVTSNRRPFGRRNAVTADERDTLANRGPPSKKPRPSSRAKVRWSGRLCRHVASLGPACRMFEIVLEGTARARALRAIAVGD